MREQNGVSRKFLKSQQHRLVISNVFDNYKGMRRVKSTFYNEYKLIPSSIILSVTHSSTLNPVSYTFIRNCKTWRVVNVSSIKPLETLKSKVKEAVTKALDADIDLDEFKDEVWNDLSAIYYKYETEEQKRAFREVMYEICEKIKEGKWDSVYKKLYREEQKDKII